MYSSVPLSPVSQLEQHGLAHYHDLKETKRRELQNVRQTTINNLRQEHLVALDDKNKNAREYIRASKNFSNDMKENSLKLQQQDYLKSKRHILSDDWITDNKDMITNHVTSATNQILRDIEEINNKIKIVNMVRGDRSFQLSESPISIRPRSSASQYTQDTTPSQNKTSQTKTKTPAPKLQSRYHDTPIPTPAGAIAKGTDMPPSPSVARMRSSNQSQSQWESTIDTSDSARFDNQSSMGYHNNDSDDYFGINNEPGGFTSPSVERATEEEVMNSLPIADNDSMTNDSRTATSEGNDTYPCLPKNNMNGGLSSTVELPQQHKKKSQEMSLDMKSFVDTLRETDDTTDEDEEEDEEIFILTQYRDKPADLSSPSDTSALLTQADIEGHLLQYGQGYMPKSQLTLSQFNTEDIKEWEEWLSPTEIAEKIRVMLEALNNEMNALSNEVNLNGTSHMPPLMYRLRRTISLLLVFLDNIEKNKNMSYRSLYYVEGGVLLCSYGNCIKLVNKISEVLHIPVYGLGITPNSRGKSVSFEFAIRYDLISC